jgi:hypothetical protein
LGRRLEHALIHAARGDPEPDLRIEIAAGALINHSSQRCHRRGAATHGDDAEGQNLIVAAHVTTACIAQIDGVDVRARWIRVRTRKDELPERAVGGEKRVSAAAAVAILVLAPVAHRPTNADTGGGDRSHHGQSDERYEDFLHVDSPVVSF